ncbi:conjugative transposon protein TraM [Flavitalea flava]
MKRKKLLFFPAMIIPGLIGLFAAMGGGLGIPDKNAGKNASGFNNELPKAKFDRKDDKLDKLGYYARADADSIKKQEISRQDPYHKGIVASASLTPPDSSADILLRKIDQLKQALKQAPSEIPEPGSSNSLSMHPVRSVDRSVLSFPLKSAESPSSMRSSEKSSPLLKRLDQLSQNARPMPDTPENDPQLDKLNTMLDKIIKIQRTVQGQTNGEPAITSSLQESTLISETKTIPAVIEGNQTIVSGSRIALRITEKCTINKIPIGKDQLVYGWGTINKDRMDILIDGIREGNSIFPVKLQVYDMDGMPGIFIPGLLTRDVSKESADQGISSIGLYAPDGSITGQATSAGIQAAKSLLHHKIKLVRVSVKSGYRVLLRNLSSGPSKLSLVTDTMEASQLHAAIPAWTKPPLPYLHQSTSNGKVHLTLLGIYLKNKTLWFSVTIQNKSHIDFIPENIRWFIRDRRQLKRTAIQEITLKSVDGKDSSQSVPSDSIQTILTGFQPFVLAEEKELILQVNEQHGGRQLVLTIHPKKIINAKIQCAN